MTRHVASKIESFRTSQSTILGTDFLVSFSVVAPYDTGTRKQVTESGLIFVGHPYKIRLALRCTEDGMGDGSSGS